MKSYPLQWPPGWRRTSASARQSARFNTKTYQAYTNSPGGYHRTSDISIAEGTKRVLAQLRAFGVEEGDAIISTNLKLRLDGLPRGDQSEPTDPGFAVYWQRTEDTQYKVMALDRYDRTADNLAAIAATLDAMRAIERHGGGVILQRAFLGFQCLPEPNTWRSVFRWGDEAQPTMKELNERYKDYAKTRHPDTGGSEAMMQELNWAKAEAEKECT